MFTAATDIGSASRELVAELLEQLRPGIHCRNGLGDVLEFGSRLPSTGEAARGNIRRQTSPGVELAKNLRAIHALDAFRSERLEDESARCVEPELRVLQAAECLAPRISMTLPAVDDLGDTDLDAREILPPPGEGPGARPSILPATPPPPPR